MDLKIVKAVSIVVLLGATNIYGATVLFGRLGWLDGWFGLIAFGFFATAKLRAWYVFFGLTRLIAAEKIREDIEEFKRRGIGTSIKAFFRDYLVRKHDELFNHDGRLARWLRRGEWGTSFLAGLFPLPGSRITAVFFLGVAQENVGWWFLAVGNFINTIGTTTFLVWIVRTHPFVLTLALVTLIGLKWLRFPEPQISRR